MTRQRSPKIAPGRIVRELSEQEVKEAVTRWLDCFGANRAGANTKAYLWHVFSSECFPSVSREAALLEYSGQQAVEYVVLSNDRDEGFITDVLPTSSSLSDWLVFPPNLAWTMAFTHEDGWLGPYFARNPAYSALNAENLLKVRKEREAEQARKKGWC